MEEEVGYGEDGERRCRGDGEHGSRRDERDGQDDGEAEGGAAEVAGVMLAERWSEGDGRKVVVEALPEGLVPDPTRSSSRKRIARAIRITAVTAGLLLFLKGPELRKSL